MIIILFVGSFSRESYSYMYQTKGLEMSVVCCHALYYSHLVADKEHLRVMFIVM